MALIVSTANAEKYFVLDVNRILDSLTFNSISLREIDKTIKYAEKSGFLIKTISFENADVQKIYYNMSESKNYLVYIPYNENAARIEIYNTKNSKIMDIDVSSFSNTCGNKICEEHESYESCTKDCPSGAKDDFCDEVKDGVCDPDCSPKTDADCGEGKLEAGNGSRSVTTTESEPIKQTGLPEEPQAKSKYLIWILSASAVIAAILLFLFLKKRKENQVVNSLRQYISENITRGFTLQQIKDTLFREGYTEKEVQKAVRAI